MKPILALCVVLSLALPSTAALAQTPASRFFDRLGQLCGQTYTGQVVTGDPADAAFRPARLVMTVERCDAREIRIPFHVGEDRSRTWVITRLDDGRLRLKHDHRHADGSEDALSQYGGETIDPGSDTLQRFPVDAESKDLFTRLDRAVSNTNVWTLGATENLFTYELSRPNRLFRVAFDLTRPVAAR